MQEPIVDLPVAEQAIVPSSGGVTVAAYDFGGDGPPLVLAHATGLHARVWAPVVEHLTPRAHCYALDARGHGDSSAPPDGDFAWTGVADDVMAVIHHFDLVRPFGVGHSMGGAALFLAEIGRPGTWRAVYGYEPIVFPAPGPGPGGAAAPGATAGENHLAGAARRRREVFSSRQEAFENYASKPPFATVAPEALRAYVEFGFEDLADGSVRLKCRRDHEAASFDNSANGAWDLLGRVACPVTVACGDRSGGTGPPMAEAQVGRLADARLEVLEGLGHFGPLEDPTRVAHSILSAFGL